ncbi:hypothetical protein [Nocardioides sp.]|uniref:hypothetical protein n=1 Tax=Nocardioides sp. TaxID=35761 RepID=UPI0035146F7B
MSDGEGDAALSSTLLAVADELYALAPGEFTAARDARVREARGTPLAARLKALRRPSSAAWVVDLLVRRDPAQVEQLISVGAALREAQEAMAAGELRALTRQRRQVTAAVTTGARRLAAAEGLRVTEAVAEQVEATLTAAMLDAGCARALASGLLVTPLRTTGLTPVEDADLHAALALPEALGHHATPREAPEAPAGGQVPALRVVHDPGAALRRLEAARERVETATERDAGAAAALAEATDEVERLAARSLQIEAEIDELRRRLAELEDDAEALEEEQAEAEEAQEAAGAEQRTAAAELAAARAALERLEQADRPD